ncbi:hypothetical protein AO066_02860 [Pseudomonas fluorescens]|nr:hypothetical protein AO066_02860 [Pseudomonas fluorescens]
MRKERLSATPIGAKAITADQRQIQRLKALLREKDLDIEILKKGQCSTALGRQTFTLIDELDEQYGVIRCCRAFGVDRSSFYAWRQRQGRANPKGERLKNALVKHHKASRASAG